jgi:hypothetical protein
MRYCFEFEKTKGCMLMYKNLNFEPLHPALSLGLKKGEGSRNYPPVVKMRKKNLL